MDTLHDDMLALAESLLTGESLGSAALRRAVSSAYYSLFRRLSSLCASRLSGQNPESEEYHRLYRILEHKQVRDRLNKSAMFKADLGLSFQQLLEAREWADYSVAPHPDSIKSSRGENFSASEAHRYVTLAREALRFIESLDSAAQLKLAVLLIMQRDHR